MKILSFLILALTITCGAVGADTGSADLRELQGIWRVENVSADVEASVGDEWRILNDRLVIVSKDGKKEIAHLTTESAEGSQGIKWEIQLNEAEKSLNCCCSMNRLPVWIRWSAASNSVPGAVNGASRKTRSASYTLSADDLCITLKKTAPAAGEKKIILKRVKSEGDTRELDRPVKTLKEHSRC